MNVYIVGSPWHLTLSLAMNKDDKDCIILIEKISEASVNTIIGMCKRFDVRYEVIGDIESIRFANLGIKNLFTFTAEVRTKLSSIELRTKQLISSNVINKVFYFNIYSPVTRAQLKHYFIAGIETVRVEDGICDYFNFQFLYYPLYKKIMKKTFCLQVGLDFYYNRKTKFFMSNTSSYYVFFPRKINHSKAKLKSLQLYITQIREVLIALGASKYNFKNKSLIIGQTMYEDNVSTLEEEIDIYLNAIGEEEKAVFKPHPRSSQEKIDLLKSLNRFLIFDEHCSVEELIVNTEFNTVVGLWSNTVFYAPILFGIETKSLVNDISNPSRHMMKIKNYINKNFKDVIKFPNKEGF